ncbi:MAG: transposase [Planctomycetaceae bacterium]|nr:transposase [Planctomycetaceae bacterium]
MICEKGYRNHPLSEEQKASNRLKSKVRCRIEHVFGEQKDANEGGDVEKYWFCESEVLDRNQKYGQ